LTNWRGALVARDEHALEAMDARPRRETIVITGPTGSGKTELAGQLAERLDGEIVSADSRQVYRYLDIGTAKPSDSLRSRVPHHGLDILDPAERYSAGRFARDAREWIGGIVRRGRVPIVVGGTGFFIRALLEPLAPEPDVEPERRERLRDVLRRWPTDELRRWLERLDPRRASQLENEGGPQRLARSLEVVLLSGRSHSWWLDQPSGLAPLASLVVCLRLTHEQLYRRIDRRFDEMMAGGLLEEVRGLTHRFGEGAPGLKSVGYVELVSHLRGERTLVEAVELAKRNTRQFARRQLTWFRHQLPAEALWIDVRCNREELVEEIVRHWEGDLRTGSRESSPIASGD
jgi:tRNA dimethylallyltransferase